MNNISNKKKEISYKKKTKEENKISNKIVQERVSYIDITRGFALFGMIFIHIIDILSKKSVYLDYPYYIPWIEMTTILPPSIIFIFISGISMYILTQKRLQIKTGFKTFIEILKRYGKYIIISIPFCYFMGY